MLLSRSTFVEPWLKVVIEIDGKILHLPVVLAPTIWIEQFCTTAWCLETKAVQCWFRKLILLREMLCVIICPCYDCNGYDSYLYRWWCFWWCTTVVRNSSSFVEGSCWVSNHSCPPTTPCMYCTVLHIRPPSFHFSIFKKNVEFEFLYSWVG